ncbi:MAG TPA: VanW family protein [Anaerolineaceae bacterium]
MKTMTFVENPLRVALEKALLACVTGVALFLVVMVITVIGLQAWFAGRIYPGVSVYGVAVGELTPQDAAIKIASQVSFPMEGKLVLQDQQQQWIATPAELGLILDPTASASAAFQVGRAGSVFDRLKTQYHTLTSGQEISPVLVYDQRMAYIYLTNIASKVNRPVAEASLSLNGTDVISKPGQIGRTVDIPANLAAISLHLRTMQDGILPLYVIETPPSIMDATPVAETARKLLSQPLTFTLPPEEGKGGPWIVEPAALAPMLAIERIQAGSESKFELKLNADLLKPTLNKIAPSLKREARDALFTFNEKEKKLEAFQPSITGRSLDIDATIRSAQERLLKGEHAVPLIFVITKPRVSDSITAEQYGIRELIRAETSYFYGSDASRVQNIKAAASRFHGLMVAPGEVFSMAAALGDISLDNGYAEALIIVGNQTIKGVGGGVCQVSTTLFRTAFFAGFPIVQRYAHAYRVSYYEKVAGNKINPKLAGLDATVFVPLVDLKFKNDTSSWLLMETYVNPSSSSITWKFYSTSDGRKVEWDTTGPVNIVEAPKPVYRENPDLKKDVIKQVEWASDGADVTVTRTVTRGGAVLFKDRIFTHYIPWGDVFEYGPGSKLPISQ